MSDGLSDANAMGKINRRLIDATYKLRDAVKEFQEAVKDADEGHRGLSTDVEAVTNPILLPEGWKLIRGTPHTSLR